MKQHSELLRKWIAEPHKFGNLLGFTKLTEVQGQWILYFLRASRIDVLQAHRNAYKTTAGLVALMLYYMLYPDSRVLIARKTLEMAQKLIIALEQLFEHPLVKAWYYAAYGVTTLQTDRWSKSAMQLSVKRTITAEPSAQAAGINTSRTGDHYDLIWADDIVTVQDRYSKAERDATKNYVYELENIIEPEGKIFVSGTPWHPDDAFSILPEPRKYPIRSVQIVGIDEAWIANTMAKLPKSLWAANYELRHIKDVDKEFGEPIPGEPPPGLTKYWFIDPAFGGADSTAIWEGCTDGELIYLTWAKMFRRSIAEKYDELEQLFWARDVAKVFFENVGAQKLLGVELERRRIPCEGVPSNTNKFARITAALKPVWQQLRFHTDVLKHNMAPTEPGDDTPPNPLIELLEYNIDAQHDDSPDACAGLVSQLQAHGEIDYEDILDIQRQIS
jgi:hypothetical protein